MEPEHGMNAEVFSNVSAVQAYIAGDNQNATLSHNVMKRKECKVSFEKIDPPMGHNQGMNAEAVSDVSAIQSISKYPLITWPQSRKSNIAGEKQHTTHSHNVIVVQSAKNQLIRPSPFQKAHCTKQKGAASVIGLLCISSRGVLTSHRGRIKRKIILERSEESQSHSSEKGYSAVNPAIQKQNGGAVKKQTECRACNAPRYFGRPSRNPPKCTCSEARNMTSSGTHPLQRRGRVTGS